LRTHPRRLTGLAIVLGSLSLSVAGCAPRAGIAYIEIENDQGSGKAEPVYVDPRLEIERNEYRRSVINEGSNILQKVRIKGPIMIVPAPVGMPTTQPAQ
jgi:hypothetical protein